MKQWILIYLLTINQFCLAESTVEVNGDTVTVTHSGNKIFSVKFDITKDFDKRTLGAAYGAGYKRIKSAFVFAKCLVVYDWRYEDEAHSGEVTKLDVYTVQGKKVELTDSKIIPWMTGKKILSNTGFWGIILSESEGDIDGFAHVNESCEVSNKLLQRSIYSYDGFRTETRKNEIVMYGPSSYGSFYKYTISKNAKLKFEEITPPNKR